jgi:Zn-dependent peptidase ImmA (M78 family)
MIPVRELINRGFIPYLKDKVEQLKAVLAFYGVSSVENWHQLWSKPPVAARRSECFDTLPGPASAWIRQGEIISNDIQCNSYNAKVFEKNLKTIKSLTVFPAEEFIEKMKVLCAEAGVALALVPEMKKVPWYGATKWINPDKAMILLNLRGKSEDKFWFSFFHEACHVLKHDKRDLLINNNDESDPREIEANEFAANFLIPIEYNDVIIKYTKVAELRKLAIEQGVSVGIVAGRYRFLTQKWDKFSSLISRFEWVTKTKDN